MAKSFSDLFMTFMFAGLFIVSILAFAITSQTNNNVSNGFSDDPVINGTYFSLKTTLGGLSNQSQAQKSLFESENPTIGFGTILLFSIVSAGKVFNGMIIAIFNTLISLPVTVLGIDPIVISVISTMLILSIIIGLWIVYKLGG